MRSLYSHKRFSLLLKQLFSVLMKVHVSKQWKRGTGYTLKARCACAFFNLPIIPELFPFHVVTYYYQNITPKQSTPSIVECMYLQALWSGICDLQHKYFFWNYSHFFNVIVNPRHACAERVTVVVSCVCMYVCPNTLFCQYAQLKV